MKAEDKNEVKGKVLPTLKKGTERDYSFMSGNKFAEKMTSEEITNLGNDMLSYFTQNKEKYLLLSYFNEPDCKIPRRTVSHWIKTNKNEHLTYCYQKIKDICCERIIDLGIGTKAMALSIFLLKNLNPDEFKDRYEQNLNITDLDKSKKRIEKIF